MSNPVTDDMQIVLAAKDHDLRIVLPTGRKILIQYREETGIVDICTDPTGITVLDRKSNFLSETSEGHQIILGVHRDHV